MELRPNTPVALPKIVRDPAICAGVMTVPQPRHYLGLVGLQQLAIRVRLAFNHLEHLPDHHNQFIVWGTIQKRRDAGELPEGFTIEEIELARDRIGR